MASYLALTMLLKLKLQMRLELGTSLPRFLLQLKEPVSTLDFEGRDLLDPFMLIRH